MVDVICDTSFLIALATHRIKNLDNLDIEIGNIRFVIPNVVVSELESLSKEQNKSQDALFTLNFIKKFEKIPINGKYADNEILNYIKNSGGIVATIDKNLKIKIKENGGSIISLSNDRIVLES